MGNAQLKAFELKHLEEYYKGNPVINGKHVIAAIHDENPDVTFPQIPELVTLKSPAIVQEEPKGDFSNRQQAFLTSSSSHTPPQQVLGLRPDALEDFLNKENRGEKWERRFLQNIKKDFDSQLPAGGLFRFDQALAYEKQPYYTPREVILKKFASMPQSAALRFQTNLKSPDVDAFVLNHEVGHMRSDECGLTYRGNLYGASDSAEFQALQGKKDQVNLYDGAREPYLRYLEEAFSDTFASLQHLKNGGSTDLLQTIQDAREHGFMTNRNAYIYPTHTTLKAVVDNAQPLQQSLAETTQEDVVRMAAGIVGQYSYNREEYYEHAMVAQAHATYKNKAINPLEVDWEEAVQDKKAPVSRVWKGYCSSRPTGFRAMFSRKQENFKNVNQFFADAFAKKGNESAKNYREARGRLTNAPLAKPEHLRAELLGHLKYVVSKHPHKSPEQLLREREAYLAEEYKQLHSDVPREIQFINADVRDHLATQRAENSEREQQEEKAVAITRSDREPEHDLNHAPGRS